MSPFRRAVIQIEYDETTNKFRAVCMKCGYFSMWHSLNRTAMALAKEHRKSRIHKTNSAAPHRYSV